MGNAGWGRFCPGFCSGQRQGGDQSPTGTGAQAPSHGQCSAGLTELTSKGMTREQPLPRLAQLALLGTQDVALGPASPAPQGPSPESEPG